MRHVDLIHVRIQICLSNVNCLHVWPYNCHRSRVVRFNIFYIISYFRQISPQLPKEFIAMFIRCLLEIRNNCIGISQSLSKITLALWITVVA